MTELDIDKIHEAIANPKNAGEYAELASEVNRSIKNGEWPPADWSQLTSGQRHNRAHEWARAVLKRVKTEAWR